MKKLILLLTLILGGSLVSFTQKSASCVQCCTPEPTVIYGRVTSEYKSAIPFTNMTVYRFVNFVPDEPITVRPNAFGYYRIFTYSCATIFVVPSHTGKGLPIGSIPVFEPSGAMYDMVTIPESSVEFNTVLSIIQ